jgi:two-component system LytT family response regulator
MSAVPLRVLIVDDEPPARRKIARFLKEDPQVTIVGEAGNGRSAIEAIRTLEPQVVFLDIQMPGVDGFGVLEAFDADELPEIVFVTAHDEYAIQAFEVAALDYLLKPFDAARFRSTLERVKCRVATHGQSAGKQDGDQLRQRVQDLLIQMDQESSSSTRILVKGRDKSSFLEMDTIGWIRGAGNYVELHTAETKHLVRETLDKISGRLDARRFYRVHRSYVVNIDQVREIQPLSHGDHLLVMLDGNEIRLSRRYRSQLPPNLFQGI